LKSAVRGVRLRVSVADGPPESVRLLALAFANAASNPPARPPVRAAWGRILEPPRRSQAVYPEGVTKWCSPASTSMLLGFWAAKTGDPAVDLDVPAAAAAVYDDAWAGTGNWPFNTALLGARPGLRACVARLEDLADLEAWTAAGLPAAASLSYALMQGRPAAEPGDGHLVVVCGFDGEGRVVINDPGVRPERVRRVVPRDAFDRAWAHSGRTAYLAWPESASPPLPQGPSFSGAFAPSKVPPRTIPSAGASGATP
jgi:hypothetical protein